MKRLIAQILLVALICPAYAVADAEFTGIFYGVPPAGSEWAINPSAPTTGDVITFSGFTEAYSNECYLYTATKGLPPILTVSSEDRGIEMSFHKDPGMCLAYWDPLYASIGGEFGPLGSGDWRFFSNDMYTTFSIEFTVSGRLFFVNAANGNDTNNGTSPETAFATIQKAIDAARDGETISVAPGTYAENIDFLGKNITLTGADPTNSSVVRSTTIDGSVTFRGTENAECTLAGFKINGPIRGYDFSIDPDGKNHTHANISHCIIENFATGCGNLVYACDGVISNCIFANISYMCLRPSPVTQIVACHGLIENCTMASMYDGIEVFPGGTTTLKNCILHNSSWFLVPSEATLNISYCDVEREPYTVMGYGTVNWGPGNFDADPCFADEGTWQTAGDYHLKSQAGRYDANEGKWTKDEVTSPCIDAGDPATYIDYEPFPNGGIVNMGAYGGTPEASKSYFGKPPCTHIIAGDANGDCIVDLKDIAIALSHWLEDSSP
ncbi:MAG: DUF1565 domain-containing protein [Planctomycetota bacterium]|jgi:hypothetical protein